MTEPQVWTVIGMFSAMFISMLTVIQTNFVRVLRAEIGTVRAEIGSVRGEIHSLRNEMKSDMAALESRVDTKLSAMDRDIQTLMRREWDGGTP